MAIVIRQLGPQDAGAYLTLRQESLGDAPHAFLSSPADDRFVSVDATRALLAGAPDAATFGACDGELLGTVTLIRSTRLKSRHKADLVGMYVSPARRRRGIGRRLLAAAIAHARTLEGLRAIHLGVSDAAPGARALYEHAGFRWWGTEDEALCVDGVMLAEHHMRLVLA